MKSKLSKGEAIIGVVALGLCFLILIALALFLLPRAAHANEFIPILADNPKAANMGTYLFEGGLSALFVAGVKIAFDENGAKQQDWIIPILPTATAGLMDFTEMYGGWSSRQAWTEFLVIAGCSFIPVITFDFPKL